MPEHRLEVVRHGLLYEPRRYPDVKDPSPVFDGERWHLFGTGCGVRQGTEIMHVTGPSLAGPWREEEPPLLRGVNRRIPRAAPGVVPEGSRLHLFLQDHFDELGGRIHHLVSRDGGHTFVRRDTALKSRPFSRELGIYDPDGAEIHGDRYLTYAAMEVPGRPDLYLATSKSGSWDGPWQRMGCILDHPAVPFHNQHRALGYEWGLEGPQLLELPGSGAVLLTAVCFLSDRPKGHRQRLLLAVADQPPGPYVVLGTPVPPSGPDGPGENGHGTAVLADGLVHLVYQERAGDGRPWRFMRATVEPDALVEAAARARGT